MTPFEILFLFLTLSACLWACVFYWQEWWSKAPLFAIITIPMVFAFNFFCPTDWIEGMRSGLVHTCMMTDIRTTKTSDMNAIPEELHEGLLSVEPTQKKIEWFCKG